MQGAKAPTTNFKRLGVASVSIDLGAKAPTTNFKRLGAASVSIDLGAKAPTTNFKRLGVASDTTSAFYHTNRRPKCAPKTASNAREAIPPCLYKSAYLKF